MDLLEHNDLLTHWLIHYGSFALFILLALGIVAIPLPEETLMLIAGVLMYNGKLPIPQTMIAVLLGSLCGITSSYYLGRTAGHYVIGRYGPWIGIGQTELDKGHLWFERFGKWALFVGYFIPGVRHFTGFIAGTTYLDFKQFALFAYSGGVLWVSTFLSIGYFFGNYWMEIYETIFKNIEITLEIVVIVGGILYLLRRFYLYFYEQ
jgi:membrane protein DedA with SNARE-associated domain